MREKTEAFKNLEQDVFKALENLKRRDILRLARATASYGKVALFQKKRYGATFGNLLLWIIGIAAAAYLEVDMTLTAMILPFLAFVAPGTTYQLFEEVK